jgi:YD repeat-containing protein
MTTEASTCECKVCEDESRFPNAFVVHLSGSCCRCGETDSKHACSKCKDDGPYAECRSLNQSVVVRRESEEELLYTHTFQKTDFAANKKPLRVEKLTLRLTKHEVDDKSWYSACVVLSFEQGANLRPVAWYRAKVHDCCSIGSLRLHAANAACRWPKSIEINGTPTPDYAPPQPEWVRGHPDDLNDASYWPAMDVPLMQDSPEVNVRYFNGELQLRIKDIGSDGFGIPWGHTRIYSNRLSNSYDFGNGTNWLVHEWPELVRRKTDPVEVAKLHPGSNLKPTGCTIVILRGTRNAIWFDEVATSNAKQPTEWRARFGAKHSLEYNATNKNFRVITANGHKWEFHPFSPPECMPKGNEGAHDRRLDGKLIRHVAPGGNSISASYKDGLLEKFERTAEQTETFTYEYFDVGDNKGKLHFVTWKRGKELLRVEYTYYGKKEAFGDLGDLKTVITAFKTTAGWKHRDNCVHYYRYKAGVPGNESKSTSNDTYCQGMLRHVVSPETYHRLRLAGHDPLSASDSILSQFADVTVEYHDSADAFTARCVKSVSLFGGSRQHTFEYERKNPEAGKVRPDFGLWYSLTKESRPDGSHKLICSNFIGQTKRHDLIDGADRWTHAWVYDFQHAGVRRLFHPNAIDDSQATLQYDAETAFPRFRQESGRGQRFQYYTPPHRQAIGYLKQVFEQEGETGTQSVLATYDYREVNADYAICALTKETKHGIAVDSKGHPGDGTTEFDHTFAFDRQGQDQDSTDGLACLLRRRTILPTATPTFWDADYFLPKSVVPEVLQVFDKYGNTIEVVDQRGTITTTVPHIATGTPVKEIISYRARDGKRNSLKTDFARDDFGRIVEVLGPAHAATLKVGEPEQVVRAATWYVYKGLSGEVWTAQGYSVGSEGGQGSPRVCLDPVHVAKHDLANRIVDEIVAVRGTNLPPTPEENLGDDQQRTKWIRWTHQEYNTKRTSVINRVYHHIPPPQGEVPGVKYYDETVSSSNIAERSRTVSVAGGTHYRTNFNTRGFPLKVESGCSLDSLKVIATAEYDNNGAGGNGNLTSLKRNDGKGNDRKTTFKYDSRNRQTETVEADGTAISYQYNSHRTIWRMERTNRPREESSGLVALAGIGLASALAGQHSALAMQAAAGGPVRPLAQQALVIDARGRVVAKQLNGYRYSAPDQLLEPLTESFLYDDANQLVAYLPHGTSTFGVPATPIIAAEYDGMGRVVVRRSMVVYHDHDTFEQTETFYNEVGDPVLVTTLKRHPDEWLEQARRDRLGNENGMDLSGNPGAAPAWVSTTGNWFDPLGRKVASCDFGSKHFAQTRPSTVDRDEFPTTVIEFDARGQLSAVQDPLKHTTRLAYDNAGRCVAIATNLESQQFADLLAPNVQAPGALSLGSDASFAQLGYTPENRVTTSTFHNSSTGLQSSKATYGIDNTNSSAEPPSAHQARGAVDALGRKTLIDYNALGEIVGMTDANGTKHVYTYDNKGRIESDSVWDGNYEVTSGDGCIRRIQYGYDEFGRLSTIQSYSSRDGDGTLLNSVVRKYGSFNELIAEAQLHTPKEAANGGGLTSNKDLFHGEANRFSLSKDTAPGLVGHFYLYPDVGQNVLQHKVTWYPGDDRAHKRGRWISKLYSARDLALGRVTCLSENQRESDVRFANRTVSYKYFGQGGVHEVRIERGNNFNVRRNLSFAGSSAMASLDVLGREKVCQWRREAKNDPTDFAVLDDIEFAYDLNDNIRWRKNRLTENDSNRYADDLFQYDRLNRLELHEHGKLLFAGERQIPRIADDPRTFPKKLHQRWGRDQSGNWRHWLRREFLNGLYHTRAQVRDHNKTNDIFQFRNTIWPTPVYDAAGQMTQMPQPGAPELAAKAKYDGWGRLTEYTDSQGVKTTFEYDGLGRRIVQRSSSGVRHFYYDQLGRVISEMREVGNNKEKEIDREYIWDPNMPHRLVCRLRYPPGGGEPERLYPLYDSVGNVTAIVDDQGEVQERYVYDAQGHITYLDANFDVVQVSLHAWEYHFGGLRFDRVTKLHFAGSGYYHADLGRGLPGSAIPVLPESAVNDYAEDFPFGSVRPAGIMGRQSAERFFKWVGEQSPWLKFGIGAAALTITVGVLVAGALTGNPYALFAAVGAACGAIQGGVGAGLNGGDFGDVMLGVGLGAAFGAVCPWGGIGSLAGSGIGISAAALSRGAGEEWVTLSMGWEWGGLIGGVAGGVRQGMVKAAEESLRRPLLSGIIGVGPDLLGGGAGAYIGYNASGGDLNTAFHGATMGMMAANLSGAAARGLWGLRASGSVYESGTQAGGFTLFGVRRVYLPRTDAELALALQLRERAMKIAQSEAFLRWYGFLDDSEARGAFFYLLEHSRPALSTFGGEAGFLRDVYTGERFLGLALSRWSGKFGTIHELHHVAREAIFRARYGRSLYLEELTTRSTWLRMKLFLSEEVYSGVVQPLILTVRR